MFKKILSLSVIFCFFLTTLGPLPKAHADTVLGLPAPGTMVHLSPAYEPTLIKGLIVHKDNPFLFDFIVDTGNSGIAGDGLKKEGDRLVKYFFACLTIPEKDLWVNLSPYEKDRMVPQALGQTALGRDLLAQDYILKQLTASLIYPEKDLGKSFWDRVYAKAQQMYGTTQIPVNTFNKVWIVADKASVYEHGQAAFVVSGHMKVMLEEDYLALQKHNSSVIPAQAGIHSVGSQIVRQIVLPEIEKEVNTGKNFATLRQIFNSLILASWYKKNLKEALLTQVYANKSTVKGVNLADLSVKQQIYQQYLKAYKKGVFNYIKEDAQPDGQTIPRKYFSGGFDAALVVTVDPNPADVSITGKLERFDVVSSVNSTPVAPAMTTPITAMTASQSGYGKISEMYPVRGSIIGKTFDIFHGEGSAAAKSRLLVTDVQKEAISGIDQKTFEEITIYSNEFLHAQEVPDAAMAVLKKGAQKKVIGLLQNFEGLFGQISVSDQPMLNIKGIPVDVMINVYKDMRGILSQVRSLLKENGVEKEGAELIRQMQERLDTLKSRIKDAGGEVDTAMTGEIYTSIQEIFNAGLLGSPIIGRWVTIKTKTRGTIRMQVSRIPSKGTDITGLGEDDRSVTVTKAEFVRAKADAAMAADLYGNYEDMRIKAAKERASRRDIKFIVTFTDNGLEKKALVNGSNVGDVWADGLAVDEKRGLITTPVRFLPNQFIRAQVVSDAAMSSKPLSYGDRIEVKKNQTLYFRFNSYGAFDVQFHDDGVVTVNDANARPGTSPGRVYSWKVFEFLKEGRHLANIYFEGNRLYVKNLSSEQFLYTAQTNAATVAKDVAMASDYDWRNRAAAEQQQIREHIVAREAIERIERRGVGVSSSEAARVLAAAEADQKAVADQPSYMWRAKTDAEQRVMGARIRLEEVQSREARHGKGDKAVIAQVNIPGGIDLNTSNGMQWKVSRDGNGVEMNIDLAMIARIRREGIDSLSPVILRMTPVASIWPLMGLQAPAK